MRGLILPLVLTFLLAAPGAQGASPGVLAGGWAQRSDAQELTLVPKLRISPSISATGMAIGTMGYGGSSTTMTLHNELAPLRTQRSMSLTVRPDGGFVWTIDKVRPTSADETTCQMILHEERAGEVSVVGGQAVFQITGGTESWRDTCNPTKASQGAVRPGRETYAVALNGAELRLGGEGGVNWTFRRR